jgi:phytanoyl-CoA hydroxylase
VSDGRDDKVGVAVLISNADVLHFREKGFAVVHKVLNARRVDQLRSRVEPLFSGDFPSGYPDEWAWRPEFGSPKATRFMINVWKCDPSMAELVTDPELGRAAATLAGWPGARLANDALWWKPPGTETIAFHQDGANLHFLRPSDLVTCWIALDACIAGVGALQYATGSHRWPRPTEQLQLATSDIEQVYHQRVMLAAARYAEIRDPEVVTITGDAGFCSFHHGLLWHGSESNSSANQCRRSLSIHFLNSETTYNQCQARFIFARYKEPGDLLSEKHFPILWRRDGYRSDHLPTQTIAFSTDPDRKI